MSRFQIGVVFALLVVLAVVGFVLRFATSDSEVEKISAVEALTEDIIDRIVIRDPAAAQDGQQPSEGEVTLWRVEEGWLVGLENHRYRTYSTKIQEILEAVGDIQGAELVSRNPANHQRMGVSAEHAKVVEFWNGQDLVGRFLVGDKAFIQLGNETLTPWTPANQSCFVRREGGDQVYSVYCSRPDVFDAVLQQWASPVIARIPSHEVGNIHFTYRDEEFDLRPFGSVWVVEEGPASEQANEFQVRDVLRQIQPVASSDLPTLEEVEGLDFNDPDVNIKFSALPQATVESFTLRLIKRSDEGEHYINVEGEPYVYIFGELESEQLLKRANDLLTTTRPTLSSPQTGN